MQSSIEQRPGFRLASRVAHAIDHKVELVFRPDLAKIDTCGQCVEILARRLSRDARSSERPEQVATGEAMEMLWSCVDRNRVASQLQLSRQRSAHRQPECAARLEG